MSQSITVKKIPTDKKNMFIKIEVSYDIGGQNWYSGNPIKRGYKLHIQPIEIKNGMGKINPRHGIQTHIQDAKRFSQKELQSLADTATEYFMFPAMLRQAQENAGIQVLELSGVYNSHGGDSELGVRDGQKIELLEVFDEPTDDIDPLCLPMFKIKFPDGFETTVWYDEICAENAIALKNPYHEEENDATG
jgi:hypothetical protein